MVPIALALNIVVSSLGFWNYRRAGHFSGRLLLPFVLASIPAAFLGGLFVISPRVFAGLLGIALLLSAVRLLWLKRAIRPRWSMQPRRSWVAGLAIGAILGFLAGLIGVGGGIFLSPLLLLLGLADAKRTAAVSSAFILLNSMSGLFAHSLRGSPDWTLLLPLMAVVAVGGSLGSCLGARRFSSVIIQRLLGAVLLVASFKLIYQAIGS
jgi:uncharacterized membrane protein YfcA